MPYFLGIDAGGTKTRAVIVDENSKILTSVVGGPANYHNTGLEQVTTNVYRTVEEAVSKGMLQYEDITHATIGITACDTPTDYAALFGALTSNGLAFLKDKLTLVNDTKIGLWCGSRPPGVVVIAGTGSNVYGINARGEEAMAGNWGHFLGDKGSGYQLAKRMFQAVIEAHEGLGPETTLTQRLLGKLGVATVLEMVDWGNQKKPSIHEISDFAPLVLEAAEGGDEVAKQLVDTTITELGKALKTVVTRLKMETEYNRIVVVGGLFESKYFLALLEGHVTALFSHVRIVKPLVPAEVGAALLAKEEWGKKEIQRA